MSICANHYANQKKVHKTMPIIVPTTFKKWQNSTEKSQAHNLTVVGSNPTPATNLCNKINNLDHSQRLRFLGFFCCNFKCLCQPLCQPVVRFFLFFTYSDTKYYILFNFHRTFSKLHNYCSFILIYNTIKSVIIDI